MVDGATRIARDLGDPAVPDIDQDPATSVAHSAVAFDYRIEPVDLLLPFYIGINKLRHVSFLLQPTDNPNQII